MELYLLRYNIHYDGSAFIGVFTTLDKAKAAAGSHYGTMTGEWREISVGWWDCPAGGMSEYEITLIEIDKVY